MPIVRYEKPTGDVIELHKGEILRDEIFDRDITVVFLDKEHTWVDNCVFEGDLKVVAKYEGEPLARAPFVEPTIANCWIKGSIIHEGKDVYLYNNIVGLKDPNVIKRLNLIEPPRTEVLVVEHDVDGKVIVYNRDKRRKYDSLNEAIEKECGKND